MDTKITSSHPYSYIIRLHSGQTITIHKQPRTHSDNYKTLKRSGVAAVMMMNKANDRMYEDFDPVSDFISEEGCDTFILYLPGFRKEQLKVQLTTSRILRISGERSIGDNKWRHFNKEYQIPPNVDPKEITAKFEGGIMQIRQPKLISSAKAGEKDNAKHKSEVTKPRSHPQPERESDGFATPPSDFPEAKAEERTRKEDLTARDKDELSSKVEDKKTKRESGEKHKKLMFDSRFIKELRKPEKQKRLVVFALPLLVLTLLGLYIVNMYRTYSGDVQQSVLEYQNQGFQTPT